MVKILYDQHTNEVHEMDSCWRPTDEISSAGHALRIFTPDNTRDKLLQFERKRKLDNIGYGEVSQGDVNQELTRVIRKLAVTRKERDILKKAAACFAKETQPDTC